MSTNRFQKFLLLRLAGSALLFVGAGLCAAPLTWFPGAALNEPRGSAATVVSPTGKIMIFGGNPIGSANVLVYNGTDAQALNSARVAPGAVALNSGQFFVYGGRQTNTARSATSAVYSYNPVSPGPDPENPNIFQVASMITARSDMAYASDAAGYAYAIGGLGRSTNALASVERYDPGSNAWTTVTALPVGRYHFGAVFDGTNTIYTFGGRTNGTAGAETATVLSYNVSGNAWSTLSPMPIPTAGSAAIRGADGKYYVVGGTTGGVVTNVVQVYDPGSDTWQLSTPLPAAVTAAGGAVEVLGRLVVLGGADGNNVDLSTTWVSQQLNMPDAAPVFAASVPPTAIYQIPYTYTNAASGNPQPTYQLITGPAGMTVDLYSGVVTWTPQADQMGSNVVTVQASNYSGSTNRTFTIKAIGPTPDTPTNVVVTDLEENSVTLSWDPVTPVVGSMTYTVYYRYVVYQPKGGSRAYFARLISNIASPSVTIAGLATGSSHTYAVSAVAAGAESALSPTITITTLSPQPPANLRVTGLTSTSITLTWDPSPGPVTIASYEVYGWINNGTTSASFATGLTETTVTINGLVPGTSHTWGVRARDAAGNVSGFGFTSQAIVNPVPTPASLAVGAPPGGGGFQITVEQSGWVQTTLIQATTNPADPASWITIATNPPTSSTFIFTDPDASLYPLRFYRVVSP